MPATGINIIRLRRSAGLTVRDLQTVFGFSTPQAIYKWQRGDALPTLDNMVILAAVLGVRVDDILVYDPKPAKQECELSEHPDSPRTPRAFPRSGCEVRT